MAPDYPHVERGVDSNARKSTAERTQSPVPASRQPSDGESGSPTVASSPEEALKRARSLYQQAQLAAQSGNHREAFDDARRAWTLVRPFTDHSDCRRLADSIYGELDALTDRAASGRDPPDTRTPLILR